MSVSYTYEEEEDRLNRFLAPNGTGAPDTMAGRAASQPPRSPSNFNRSPSAQHFIPASVSSRSAIPIGGGRSSSFTARERSFAPRSISSSTFEEEDEDDLFPEYSSSFDNRGRPMGNDAYSRSRSQSLAPVSRPIASPPTISRFGSAYDTFLHTRFNSGPSPVNRDNNIDLSNMSPFFRDILHEDSAFQDNGGGSGTTSRRHSVSIVQPRTRNIGFNAPPQRSPEHSPSIPFGSFRGGFVGANVGAGKGGLGISDEDLADFDFGFNNLSLNGNHARDAPSSGSLPTGTSPFQPRKLHIPNGSPTTDRFRHEPQVPELTARFIPGQGIQYLPQDLGFQQPRYQHHPSQSPISPTHGYNGSVSSQHDVGLGKGVPLHAVPSAWPLYIVEFKAGRTDLFYFPNADPHGAGSIRVGDIVVVEADRGKDLGTVVNDSITVEEIEQWQQQQQQQLLHQAHDGDMGIAPPPPTNSKEINPKRMFGKANKQDVNMLTMKGQDEMKALQLCQSKVRARKLPMEVVDAEYQWDRKKLTFYFVAEKRIDFRELVRELFRLYKTRIWMASLNGPPGSLSPTTGTGEQQ